MSAMPPVAAAAMFPGATDPYMAFMTPVPMALMPYIRASAPYPVAVDPDIVSTRRYRTLIRDVSGLGLYPTIDRTGAKAQTPG
jgi:hypothetical protein